MGMEIEKRFVVHAPADAVWDFLTDPYRVARCLPGAAITETLGERTYALRSTRRSPRKGPDEHKEKTMKRIAMALVCVAGLLTSLPCLAAQGTPPAPTAQVSTPAPAPAPTTPAGLFDPATPGQANLPVWLNGQCAATCGTCTKNHETCCMINNDPPAPTICYCGNPDC